MEVAMKREKNTVIESFLKRVRGELYHLAPADDYIEMLRQDMYEFSKNNPGLTEVDLIDVFGSPEDIARDYLEDKNVTHPQSVSKDRAKRNFIIAILVICLLAAGACLVEVLQDRQGMATDVIIIEE